MSCPNPDCVGLSVKLSTPLKECPAQWTRRTPAQAIAAAASSVEGTSDQSSAAGECYTAEIRLQCPLCQTFVLACCICGQLIGLPVPATGERRTACCNRCGYPVCLSDEAAPTLSVEKARQIQVSLCGRRAYLAAKQVELQALSKALAELRAPVATPAAPLLLEALAQDDISLTDIKTPDFESYLAPPGQDKFRIAQKRKDASLLGALDDSGKSYTPSSDEKKSTGSEIRGRGAPTPITSMSPPGCMVQPPNKRRKIEKGSSPGLNEKGQSEEDAEWRLRVNPDASLSLREYKLGPRTALGAFGSNMHGLSRAECQDGATARGSSQEVDLSGRVARKLADAVPSVGLRTAVEEHSSGGNSIECTRLADESGSGQHVSQDQPPAFQEDAQEPEPHAKGEVGKAIREDRGQIGAQKRGDDEVDNQKEQGHENLNKDVGKEPAAAAEASCACGRATEPDCARCKSQEVEAALVLCRYQLLCLHCPATERQDRAAQEKLPFDRTDLAVLRERLRTLAESVGSLQDDFEAVLMDADRFLEKRPRLLQLKRLAEAALVVSRQSCIDLGAFRNRYPNSPLVGIRTLSSLLQERSSIAQEHLHKATASFRPLLETLAKHLEKLRYCIAKLASSGPMEGKESHPGNSSDFVDMQMLIGVRCGQREERLRRSKTSSTMEQVSQELQSLYYSIWEAVGAIT